MEYITIGNVKIEKTASLAPMASVADKAMRTMCKKYAASLLTVTEYERPMAIQLFGSEPEFMAKAAVIAAKYNPDFIDINCGCPVPKVAGNGAGSALMKDPVLLGQIVEAVVKATDIPVTVKIRKGWDEKNVNAVEVARVAQESGASAVAVHGRTKNQIDIIAEVKQALKIPVIGNGDIDSGESCKHMYDYTGCDLVMVGRAACGRPWIFSEIKHYLETGKILPPPSPDEQLDIMNEHIRLLCTDKGEYIGMKEARKHTAWYLKGRPGAAKLRNMCGSLSTLEDFDNMLALIRNTAQQDI